MSRLRWLAMDFSLLHLSSLVFCFCVFACMNSESTGGIEHGMLKNLQVARHKRSAPSGCASENCCQNTTHGLKNGSHVHGVHNGSHAHPHIVVHHYHHYYYCCPGMADKVMSNPELARAVGLHGKCKPDCQCGKGGPCTCNDPKGSMTCECKMTGSCSCSDEKPKSDPRTRDGFDFTVVFDDPVGKMFHNFITDNFVMRDDFEEPNICTAFPIGFDDPVCKDFFNFLSRNFRRKSLHQSAASTPKPTPTPTPPKATPQKDILREDVNKAARNISAIKSLFDSLHNEMKDTLARTSNLAKQMGFDDSFGF